MKLDHSIFKRLLDSKTIIVLAGPTASGKTAASLRLCDFIDCEILSADSRQIYKHLDIGTAKASADELSKVKHHFIDILNPDERFSAGMFGDQAEQLALELFHEQKIPLVVGGAGLYIQSLCEGFFTEEESLELLEIRKSLNDFYLNEGIEILFEQLIDVDPVSAIKYKDKNPRRVIRALEFYHLNGFPLSEAQSTLKSSRKINSVKFFIDLPREILYDRINRRTFQMWEAGILDETKKLLEIYPPDLNSLNTVGYKECIRHLNGELSEAECISEIQKNTRRYAKRQVTWFSSRDEIIKIPFANAADVSAYIVNHLNSL